MDRGSLQTWQQSHANLPFYVFEFVVAPLSSRLPRLSAVCCVFDCSWALGGNRLSSCAVVMCRQAYLERALHCLFDYLVDPLSFMCCSVLSTNRMTSWLQVSVVVHCNTHNTGSL
jgi:hypothetical protein